jgi:hypothetical protein
VLVPAKKKLWVKGGERGGCGAAAKCWCGGVRVFSFEG